MTTFHAPRPRGKLPARYAAVVMPLVLSVLMTFVVSAISTLRSLGPTPAFIATWPAAWAISWLVAFPTLLAVLPLVRKIVAFAVETPRSNQLRAKRAPSERWRPFSIPQPVRDGLAHHVGQRLAG
jgi:hypothetical protein